MFVDCSIFSEELDKLILNNTGCVENCKDCGQQSLLKINVQRSTV